MPSKIIMTSTSTVRIFGELRDRFDLVDLRDCLDQLIDNHFLLDEQVVTFEVVPTPQPSTFEDDLEETFGYGAYESEPLPYREWKDRLDGAQSKYESTPDGPDPESWEDDSLGRDTDLESVILAAEEEAHRLDREIPDDDKDPSVSWPDSRSASIDDPTIPDMSEDERIEALREGLTQVFD